MGLGEDTSRHRVGGVVGGIWPTQTNFSQRIQKHFTDRTPTALLTGSLKVFSHKSSCSQNGPMQALRSCMKVSNTKDTRNGFGAAWIVPDLTCRLHQVSPVLIGMPPADYLSCISRASFFTLSYTPNRKKKFLLALFASLLQEIAVSVLFC